MIKFKREVTVTPSFDRRDPDPSKNYGIGSATLRMILRGPKGATQFVLSTGWLLPGLRGTSNPTPMDFGYHSRGRRYKGQRRMECNVLPSGHCYYDGSGMNADRIFNILVSKGSEEVWEELEDYYHRLFDTPKETVLAQIEEKDGD